MPGQTSQRIHTANHASQVCKNDYSASWTHAHWGPAANRQLEARRCAARRRGGGGWRRRAIICHPRCYRRSIAHPHRVHQPSSPAASARQLLVLPRSRGARASAGLLRPVPRLCSPMLRLPAVARAAAQVPPPPPPPLSQRQLRQQPPHAAGRARQPPLARARPSWWRARASASNEQQAAAEQGDSGSAAGPSTAGGSYDSDGGSGGEEGGGGGWRRRRLMPLPPVLGSVDEDASEAFTAVSAACAGARSQACTGSCRLAAPLLLQRGGHDALPPLPHRPGHLHNSSATLPCCAAERQPRRAARLPARSRRLQRGQQEVGAPTWDPGLRRGAPWRRRLRAIRTRSCCLCPPAAERARPSWPLAGASAPCVGTRAAAHSLVHRPFRPPGARRCFRAVCDRERCRPPQCPAFESHSLDMNSCLPAGTFAPCSTTSAGRRTAARGATCATPWASRR